MTSMATVIVKWPTELCIIQTTLEIHGTCVFCHES